MSALELISEGIANGLPIIPYVHGASLGRPSPCSPDKVAIARRDTWRTWAAAPMPPAAKPEPVSAILFVPGTSRCGHCGYLFRAPGHKVTCGGEP